MNTIEALKALSHETRLRMLNLLIEAEDLCACELEALLDLSQSNASRHLSRLRQAGLIAGEKRGQWMHFRPSAEAVDKEMFVTMVLRSARETLSSLHTDLGLLDDYRKSPYRCTTIKQWSPTVREGSAHRPRMMSTS